MYDFFKTEDPVDFDDHMIYDGEFKQKDLLSYHKKYNRQPTSWTPLAILINEGEKRYECKECGAKYNAKKYFVDHALNHTGERSFKCRIPECTMTYKNWESLRRHLVNHIAARRVGCSKCMQRFKDKDDFYYHKKVRGCRGEMKKVFRTDTKYT